MTKELIDKIVEAVENNIYHSPICPYGSGVHYVPYDEPIKCICINPKLRTALESIEAGEVKAYQSILCENCKGSGVDILWGYEISTVQTCKLCNGSGIITSCNPTFPGPTKL